MRQFVSAFNSIVINRYNKNRSVQEKIQVNFVYAPKERVIYDLVNRSQHIKLPIVAVTLAGVSRDEERAFNKVAGYYLTKTESLSSQPIDTNYMKTPIPVNIEVNMEIMTKFQTDMDQILSNFVPYTNPYIIISWKIPSSQNLEKDYEIRSEVLWNGNININYPDELTSNQPYRVIGTTSFTIKGWLFKNNPDNNVNNIFVVDQNFVPVDGFEYD